MPQRLSFTQTYRLWGGLSLGAQVLRGIIVIDVTVAARGIAPDLDRDARVGAIHLSSWHVLRAPNQIKRDIVKARRRLIDSGYTHVAITGPMAGLARARLAVVAEVANAVAFAAVAPISHMITLCALWLAAGARGRARRQRLHGLMAGALRNFTNHAIFAL
jgi:hypothetical protein